MRLDISCVRSVLLEFEEFPFGVYTPCDFRTSIAAYGLAGVEYTLAKLAEAGYINAKLYLSREGTPEFNGIFDITFSGHQFLETIRDGKVWQKTKNVADSIGSRSFDVITKIAGNVLSGLISAKIGL